MPLHRHGQDLARLAHHGGVERPLALQQPEFTQESAGSVHRHRALVWPAEVVEYLYGPAEDREELPERLALAVQHLALGGPSALTVRGQVLELFRRQARERPVSVRCLVDRTLLVLGRAHQTMASWT